MKFLFYLVFLFVFGAHAQNDLEAVFLGQTELSVDRIIDIDNFETLYYLQDNIFYKQSARETINYSNVQLGEISTIDVFNPLKINLFYADFNTVIILDNRLAEIFKIDFNTIIPYKNISHVSVGNDNTIWIFNQDLQYLELFDYLNNKSRARTLPIQSKVLDLTSNFNFCWLLTENYLYKYNYFGSLIYKIDNEGFTALDEDNGNIILMKDNELFYQKKGEEQIIKINTPELLINQFLLTNETLYIYQPEILTKFQLKK